MDLVFNALPDVFSYQSFRHAAYDAPWLNDNNNKRAGKQQQQQQPVAVAKGRSSGGCSGSPKDSCPLCLEKQRRPLATYIRSKSRQDRREESAIREEDEEEETARAGGDATPPAPPAPQPQAKQ